MDMRWCKGTQPRYTHMYILVGRQRLGGRCPASILYSVSNSGTHGATPPTVFDACGDIEQAASRLQRQAVVRVRGTAGQRAF